MTEQQTTNTVLMVSPDTFQFNEQTAQTNAFQKDIQDISHANKLALTEFTSMVSVLRAHQIHVIALSSRADVATPDAVFPNNWFSTHLNRNGKRILVLYPMLAESRRLERQYTALQQALLSQSIHLDHIVDLTHFEQQGQFLEGTGSMVLDRVNHVIYAALSPRTNETVLKEFAKELDYTCLSFNSEDKQGKPVYHTNVLMSVGTHFVVVVLDSIKNSAERDRLSTMLVNTKKTVINISLEQMENMAGNILEVKNMNGLPNIVMSKTAFAVLTSAQRQQLSGFGELVVVDIPTIERLGGGSARCMLAEIF